MSEEFFASDYVAQAEEFFWRAISTPRLARKATYLKAAAKSLEKAIGLAEASPQRQDGESVEHAVRALAQKILNLQGTVEDMRLREEAHDAGPPRGPRGPIPTFLVWLRAVPQRARLRGDRPHRAGWHAAPHVP